MTDETANLRGVICLKYWHVVLVLAVQLICLGAAYGRITANQDNFKEDVSRRLAVIESNKVISREEFDEWRGEFEQNLRDLQHAIIRSNLGEK